MIEYSEMKKALIAKAQEQMTCLEKVNAKETDKSNTKTLFQVAKTFIESVERVGKR